MFRPTPFHNAELQRLTGASAGTIRNNLSQLMQAGEVEEDGYKGRSKVYRLLSSSNIYREGGDDDNEALTAEQVAKYQRLRAEGMGENQAIAEVRRKGT